MILTLTLNAAFDRVIFIKQFEPMSVMQAIRVVDSVGGKGFDTSVTLSALGAGQLALGFVSGKMGEELVRLLDRYHIPHELIWVEGETRMANVIAEVDLHRHSHIMTPGYTLEDGHIDEMMSRLDQRLPGADWIVLAGSLPKGSPTDVYARVIQAAKKFGVKTLLDCRAEPALAAISARPNITKMNENELKETFGLEFSSDEEMVRQVKSLVGQRQLESFVITSGKRGIIAITGNKAYQALPPQLEPVNAAGAGDAASAALVYRFSLGDSWEQALRWAGAVSAASVLTEPTAECNPSDIAEIFPRVMVKELY